MTADGSESEQLAGCHIPDAGLSLMRFLLHHDVIRLNDVPDAPRTLFTLQMSRVQVDLYRSLGGDRSSLSG
ncbi:hypothetical protein GJV06_12775 [Enterobacteriaceae bacterium RIT691]|nr:hypothetical protein [Enterobacteriaceae bacterium RIT691]